MSESDGSSGNKKPTRREEAKTIYSRQSAIVTYVLADPQRLSVSNKSLSFCLIVEQLLFGFLDQWVDMMVRLLQV